MLLCVHRDRKYHYCIRDEEPRKAISTFTQLLSSVYSHCHTLTFCFLDICTGRYSNRKRNSSVDMGVVQVPLAVPLHSQGLSSYYFCPLTFTGAVVILFRSPHIYRGCCHIISVPSQSQWLLSYYFGSLTFTGAVVIIIISAHSHSQGLSSELRSSVNVVVAVLGCPQ